MAQANDLGAILNQSRTLFHQRLNIGFQALATGNSGPSEPVPSYAYMTWYDTNAHQIKIRNGSNTGWLTVGVIDTNTFSWGSSSTPATSGVINSGSLSGASVDMFSIPAGITSFDLILVAVGCNTFSSIAFELGTASGIVTSGYASAGENIGSGGFSTTGGIWLGMQSSTTTLSLVGNLRAVLSSSNRWTLSGVTTSINNASDNSIVGGTVVLPGALDRCRILTTAGAFVTGAFEIRWYK